MSILIASWPMALLRCNCTKRITLAGCPIPIFPLSGVGLSVGPCVCRSRQEMALQAPTSVRLPRDGRVPPAASGRAGQRGPNRLEGAPSAFFQLPAMPMEYFFHVSGPPVGSPERNESFKGKKNKRKENNNGMKCDAEREMMKQLPKIDDRWRH